MKKNILAENMRRFNTKNLQETESSKKINWRTAEFEDIDPRDHPDYTDAYVSYVEYEDGTPLNDEELDKLWDTHYNDVYDALMNYLH
jgi:hypothetical protein